jgi:predicted dienelactone hydrolase
MRLVRGAVALVGSWCFLSACGEAPSPALAPLAEPTSPSALGPYEVGVTTLQGSDGEEGGRSFPIEVWYPARPAAGAPLATYELTAGVLVLAQVESPRGAVRDAPPDVRDERYPVVVFSHGSFGVRFQSVYLTEYLASHGFVVAAPDHAGNTIAEGIDSSIALPAAEMARLRPIDVSRTLDAVLQEGEAPGSLLSGLPDGARAGVAGHSFGGFTSMRIAGATFDFDAMAAHCELEPGDKVCEGWADVAPTMPASARDPRFLAALPQAPGAAVAFGAGIGEVAVPTFVQAGTLDDTTPYEPEARAPFEALPSPAYLLTLEGAGHFTFSDMCTLVELLGLTSNDFDDGCSPENLPWPEAHESIVAHGTAFLQRYVAGYEAADHPALAGWLDARSEPPVTLEAK